MPVVFLACGAGARVSYEPGQLCPHQRGGRPCRVLQVAAPGAQHGDAVPDPVLNKHQEHQALVLRYNALGCSRCCAIDVQLSRPRPQTDEARASLIARGADGDANTCSQPAHRPGGVGIDASAYDSVVDFRDPITRYTSLQGYLFNIAFLKRASTSTYHFNPRNAKIDKHLDTWDSINNQ
ncbi:uncharacterized protein HaLaN_22412, partial [Haematococcus lacustris]